MAEANEGKGKKVAIGCCSAAAVVGVIAVIAFYFLGQKGFELFKDATASHAQLVEAVSDWRQAMDAADGDVAAVSPVTFEGFTRTGQTPDAAPPGFSLSATGHLDEYESGGTKLSVWIAEVSANESGALVERAKEQVDSNFSMKSTGSMTLNGDARFNFKASPPETAGLLVGRDGYVIFLQANDKSVDLEALLSSYAGAAAAATDGSSSNDAAAESDSPQIEVAPAPAPAPAPAR